jgi:hypothetical protein
MACKINKEAETGRFEWLKALLETRKQKEKTYFFQEE